MNVAKILIEEYRASRTVPFVWGSADCLIWAAASAIRIIGRDPIAHIRGRYSSLKGAREIMAAEGWTDMGDVAASCFAEIPVANARTGDWARVVNGDSPDMIGVFAGAMIAAKTEFGMGQVPRSRAVPAFRVQ